MMGTVITVPFLLKSPETFFGVRTSCRGGLKTRPVFRQPILFQSDKQDVNKQFRREISGRYET